MNTISYWLLYKLSLTCFHYPSYPQYPSEANLANVFSQAGCYLEMEHDSMPSCQMERGKVALITAADFFVLLQEKEMAVGFLEVSVSISVSFSYGVA